MLNQFTPFHSMKWIGTILPLLFVLTSCSDDAPVDQPISEGDQLGDFRVALPDMYDAAGDVIRETVFYQQEAVQDGQINYQDNDGQHYATEEEKIATLQALGDYSHLDKNDITLLLEFIDDSGQMNFDGDMSLSSARSLLDRWMISNDVTIEDSPLTYHTIQITKEALLTTQVSKLLENPKTGLVEKGADDEKLCSVKPRYSWPPQSLYCTKSDETASSAAKQAIALAVKELFTTATAWSSAGVGAVGIAVSLVIQKYWDDVFCKIDCDKCGYAAGIRMVYSGCTFTGIEAVGSFEFVDRFTYLVDAKRNGSYTSITRAGNAGRVPASDLPTTAFNVAVDVSCDGSGSSSQFPWIPGRTKPAFVPASSERTGAPPRPILSISQPPLTNQAGYYLPNTTLCFTVNKVANNDWTFVRWEAFEGTPSSGTSPGSFCTKWNQSTPQPRGVVTVWSHPCGGTIRVQGPSFLICPEGQCG